MSEVPLLSGLPEFLWLPLLAGGLLPVLVTSGLLLARRARGISLTTRTTLAALVLFGLGVGVMTWSATLAVLRVGLHQRHGQYLSEVVRVADDLGGYWREGPNLRSRIAPPIDLLRSANPDIGFVVLTRLHCDSDCIVLADADRPALRHFLAQAPSTDWAGREGSLVVGGELFSVVAAAVRDQRGQPIAVVLVGVEASEAARAAARAAWQLLLTAWTLLLVIALSTRGLVAASVTRRVKTLIARLEDPNAVPASRRNGDELVALSQALDEAIRHSVDRDRIQSARYQELVDNAPYGMCWLDGQHRITAGNPALARLLGAARASDLIGRDIRECFLRLTDGEALVAQLAGVTSLDAAEWNWCATDALPRTVRIVARRVGDGAELVVEDVTERRALEAQLQQAQKMEALGRLTGGVAHDFNNLLTVILGHVPFVRASLPNPPDDVLEGLSAIEQAAQRGASFIRKLLLFSRADHLELQAVSVGKVVHGVGFLLRRVLPDNIRVSTPASAPDVRIAVDQVAVEQMLLNLATNARDAMPEGGELTLGIHQEDIDTQGATRLGLPGRGRYVVLSMRDTGPGIPVSIQGRVFDPFFTTKPPGGGSGLGLSMVYGLMRRHSGTIRFHTAEGQGTTMSLYFPEQEGAATVGLAIDKTSDRIGERPRGRLLVVEDEPEVQRVTRRILEHLGYQVDVADDGQEALAALMAGPLPSAVVSDVIMPRMGGPQLLREVRAAGFQTPFIFVSAHSTEDLEELTTRDGRVWILAKPWVIERLAEVLLDVLAQTGEVDLRHPAFRSRDSML